MKVGHVYQPEELMMLRVVMERAIDSLPVAKRTPHAKQKIAHRILDCASTGERDPSHYCHLRWRETTHHADGLNHFLDCGVYTHLAAWRLNKNEPKKLRGPTADFTAQARWRRQPATVTEPEKSNVRWSNLRPKSRAWLKSSRGRG